MPRYPICQRILTVSLRVEARRLRDLAVRGREAREGNATFWEAAERAARVLWRLSADPSLGCREEDLHSPRWGRLAETRLATPDDLIDAVQAEGMRRTLEGEDEG